MRIYAECPLCGETGSYNSGKTLGINPRGMKSVLSNSMFGDISIRWCKECHNHFILYEDGLHWEFPRFRMGFHPQKKKPEWRINITKRLREMLRDAGAEIPKDLEDN